MKNFFNRVFVILNIITAALLILSNTALWTNPSFSVIPSLLGVAFPFLLFTNIIFTAVFLYAKNKFFLISLVALLISFKPISYTFSFHIPQKQVDNEFKVMSYNVRLFNIYQWIEDLDAADKISTLINEESPDILCMQEFYSSHENRNFKAEIEQAGGYDYFCSAQNSSQRKTGNIIFSKFRMVNHGFFKPEGSARNVVYADIITNPDTIRVYSVHLAPLHLSNKDYDFIDNFNESKNSRKVKGIRGIIHKMEAAYKVRTNEVNDILAHAAQSKYPVLLCGDFNEVPLSKTYKQFADDSFKDSFIKSGLGVGNTYSRNFLKFRIDYILYNRDFKPLDFSVFRKEYSDHYPIIGTFALQ